MTKDERRMRVDRRVASLQTFKPSSLHTLLIGVLVLLSLAGCSVTPEPDSSQGAPTGGSFSPEAVAESFLKI